MLRLFIVLVCAAASYIRFMATLALFMVAYEHDGAKPTDWLFVAIWLSSMAFFLAMCVTWIADHRLGRAWAIAGMALLLLRASAHSLIALLQALIQQDTSALNNLNIEELLISTAWQLIPFTPTALLNIWLFYYHWQSPKPAASSD